MFDSFQHPAGREYTTTVALLAAAFIFIPALVAVSQPLSYSPIWDRVASFALRSSWHGSTGRGLKSLHFRDCCRRARQQNDSFGASWSFAVFLVHPCSAQGNSRRTAVSSSAWTCLQAAKQAGVKRLKRE